jgi:glycerophosphoryl diester phosphodiesterase
MNPWPYPFWIAHRGAGKLAPENTLAAFRLGASHGYRAFECDVKLSADGVPFLLHDDTLARTTGERGLASERSWSELSRLDAGGWHSRSYAGEPLATLEAVARYGLRNGYALNLEIKPTPGQEVLTGRIVAHEAARLWATEPVKPLLSSFEAEALRAAQAAEPALPRALLLEDWRPDWLEEAQSLGCVAVVADYRCLDPAAIGRIHAAGMRSLCYTVNDPAPAQSLIAAGIDGIITDAVDRFAPGRALVSD